MLLRCTMDTQSQIRPVFSVVVPMFNEAEVIGAMHRRLAAAMATLNAPWEVIYVNDGSRDTTLRAVEMLRQADHHIALVNLSRNFGKEIATTAGLDHARGDAVIVIDADLQDPPEVIPQLVDAWHAGYDMVYAQRRLRDGETWLKRQTAAAFSGPIGAEYKTHYFAAGEFNREVNTCCSKSNDLELTNTGLEMKNVVEQFREQVQNLE